MSKSEFIARLRAALSGIPKEELEERLAFYSEMIDDRMEEGLAEEEAVGDIGSVEDIAAQIIAETPLVKLVKEKVKPKRKLRAWEIVLIAVGFPVWLPLLMAAFIVILSLYFVVWSVMLSLWAVFAAVALSAVGCVALGVCLIVLGKFYLGLASIGAGMFCAGLSIFIFIGCIAATRGVAKLTKKAVVGVKNRFVKKEAE